jgi:hypothetical protein
MLFVTLEDLPYFKTFLFIGTPWSHRATELQTPPYRWSLFSLLLSFFSETWNNQVEKIG